MKKLLFAVLITMVLMLTGCPDDVILDDIFDALLQNVEFLPNSGGQIGPFEPFERTTGVYGMLLIDTVERNNGLNSTTYFEVDMSFTPPSELGADSYTLEYSSEGDVYQTYKHDGSTDLVTPSTATDNFSISPGGSYYFRLAISGGDYDGWHSNVVYAPFTSVATYWAGWSLNADMINSDPPVMVPFIGNTREVSMSVNRLSDLTAVDYTPTYQWYRLNPATYQMTEIPGATNTTYTTTEADAGYDLVVRGTGDEEDVGGFQQVHDTFGIKIPNRSYALDADLDGFYLALEHAVAGLDKDDFVLYAFDYSTQIPITALTPVEDHLGLYRIDATIAATEEEVYLVNTGNFWTVTSFVTDDHPWAESLTIEL